MSRHSAPLTLSAEKHSLLDRFRHSTPQQLALRARMIVLADGVGVCDARFRLATGARAIWRARRYDAASSHPSRLSRWGAF